MTSRRRWGLIAAAAFVALVAWALWWPSNRPYIDMVASLRAAGEPVDYDGLVGAPVPDEENGAAGLIAAKTWLHQPQNVPYGRWDEVVGPWNMKCEDDWPETSTADELAELTKFLVLIAPYRAQVAAAAAKPHLQEPRQPRSAWGFPETSFIPGVQEAVRVLSAAAVGAPDEASRLDAIAMLAQIGNRIDTPLPIHQMVASASVSYAAREVRRVLEKRAMDPAAARARLDPLLRTRWLDRVPPTLRGERTFMITSYAALVAGEFPFKEPSVSERIADAFRKLVGKGKPASPWPFAPIVQPTRQEVVDQCAACTAALRVPLGPYAEYRNAVVRALHVPGASSGIAVEPTYGRILGVLCRIDAQQRLARIALAAAEHRATHGDFPASLDDLKPMFPDGIPLDPFTDAAFVYERTATGAHIASAGRFSDEDALDAATLRERVLVWELKR